MRERKKKRLIIFAMIGLLFIMAAGYAAFQTNLDIKGTSSINSNWDIRITNVTESNKHGEAESAKAPTWEATKAYMEANLYNKGDYIEYDVTIENKGTFDAKLDNVISNVKSNNEAVLITFSGYTKGQILQKGTTQNVKVKIEYNPNYEGEGEGSGEVEVDFDYTQNEGGTIVPTNDYLVTYNCITNGGSDCTSFNEYVSEGSSINLTHQGTNKKFYKFIGWNTDASATVGLTSLNMGSNDITLYAIYSEIDSTAPIIDSVNTSSTTSSITVVVSAHDDETKITKYEYSKDGGKTWETSDSNTYTFTGLTQDTEYDIKVRVTNEVEKTAESENTKVTTNILEKPTFTEEETSKGKDVTIHYPEGCGDTLTCTYVKNNGEEKEVKESTVVVSFESDGNLIAKVTDGINEASSTYTVTLPAVIQSWSSDSSTDFHASEYRENIITATFLDNKDVQENAIQSWDVSDAKNGSVMAWIVSDETDPSKYHLYIGGNGGVIANENSSHLFRNFIALTEINFNDNFNTSNVTNMQAMFAQCAQIYYLDLTSFDTSNVTNMRGMFSGNQVSMSFTEIKGLEDFDTTNVTDMYAMFQGCSNLTTLDLSEWNTSNVTNMSYMFNQCHGLTTLDVSNFDTSNVIDMSYMFNQCQSLTTLDVSNFNTSKVTNTKQMFYGCISLTALDVSKWDTSEVTNMRLMFGSGGSQADMALTEIKGIEHFNTSKVTDMTAMFQKCVNLTSLDLSKWDTGNVTDMSYMFNYCSRLAKLDVSNFDTDKVTNMYAMFQRCANLTSLDLSKWNTGNVTNMSYMFNNCQGLTSLNISNFDTSNVTNMHSMFQNCANLTSLNLSKWNTSKVIDMGYMFSYCNGLTQLNVSNFDTRNVIDMDLMFNKCISLTNINLSSFDTSNVTTMYGMFSECRQLTKLNLCSFDTSKVTNMDYMFDNTTNVHNIHVGPSWTTSKATTTGMFNASGVSSVTQSDNCEIDADNISLSVATSVTTNSITVVATALADSGIAKYEYRINNGSWITENNNIYTFNGLKNNTSYSIDVRITSGVGKTATKSSSVTTNNIVLPTFRESGTTTKTITITYPSGCGSTYICSYSKDGGSSVTVTSTTANINFTVSGDVVAKVSDGANTVSSSYNVFMNLDDIISVSDFADLGNDCFLNLSIDTKNHINLKFITYNGPELKSTTILETFPNKSNYFMTPDVGNGTYTLTITDADNKYNGSITKEFTIWRCIRY